MVADQHRRDVGDGHLHYATEDILEAYYRIQIAAPAALTANYQFVAHPTYNQDRGRYRSSPCGCTCNSRRSGYNAAQPQGPGHHA